MIQPSDNVQSETVYALSSAPGRAGVSVFRVSGPHAKAIGFEMTQKPCPQARFAAFRKFYDDAGEVIDEGLVLWMPGPKSFTGEDVAEFQTHGSLAVLEAMASRFSGLGARQAEPGEFTRRAFLNGRMDLTEAEGLADLIDSETQGQRQQALKQMQGGLRETYEDWRSDLIDALAMIEGEIDFPDEGDVPDALAQKARPPLAQALENMQMALASFHQGERVRSGLDITILGAPNAGKSSLINALAGRDAAIVSDIAGTTRDIIDVQMVIAGLPVRLSDTAGLRDSEDAIESEGVRRATSRAEDSDIRLYIHDVMIPPPIEALALLQDGDVIVLNKIDQAFEPHIIDFEPNGISTLRVSAKTHAGLAELRAWLNAAVTDRFGVQRMPGLTRARHKDCVERAVQSVERAIVNISHAPELAGDDVRSSLHAIKELAGETDMDAVFDRIFSRFCIGK